MRASRLFRGAGLAVAALASSVLFAFVAASPVRAEGEAAAPVHSMYDMALAEGAMPEGWKLVRDGAAADENTLKDAIGAIAKEKGLVTDKESKIHYVMRSATCPGDKKAVYALMDLDEKSDAFTAALKEAATAKGWAYREMGSPMRLLVVSAPEDVRAKAVDVQVAYAVKQLSARAESGLENVRDRSGFERVMGFAAAALALDGKSAIAHIAAGHVDGFRYVASKQQGGEEGADKDAFEKAAAHYKAAAAKESGASPKEQTIAQGELGGLLLQKGGPSVEARDVLKEAVAGLANVDSDVGAGYQYNLACAHARLKELDDAFKHLAAVLELNSKKVVKGISHWRDGDPDFDNLKPDPRWEELKKKYPPTGGAGGDGN